MKYDIFLKKIAGNVVWRFFFPGFSALPMTSYISSLSRLEHFG